MIDYIHNNRIHLITKLSSQQQEIPPNPNHTNPNSQKTQAMAIARRILTTKTAPLRSFTSSRAYSTSRLQLVFDHHKPPSSSDSKHAQDAPIIFMHGLFGSKKNNRSVSK